MDTNRAQLSIVPEVTFKVTPDNPVWQIQRFKGGEDLKADKTTVVSEEIRSDRQISDLAKVALAANGGFAYELSYAAYSLLIAAALGTTGVVVNQTAPISLASQTLTKDGVVKATGLLTGTGAPANNDTVTIGAKTYTFKTALTDGVVANEVLIGGSLATALDNLKAAVNNAGGVSGTDYGSATTANVTVAATTNTNTTQAFEAITGGTAGNALATTATSANLSWGATTLTGGQAATWAVTPIAGQFLKVSGFATPANNGIKLVTAVTTTTITFAAGSFTVDEPNVSATIKGTAYKNGVDLPSFTIERKTVTNSGADYYQRYAGMGVDEWSLSIGTAKINEGKFSFMGSTPTTSDTPVAGATYADPPTNQVTNATSHVTRIYLDGAVNTEHLMALDFQVKNNLRAKPEIGSETPFELGNGEFTCTGKLSAYFKDNALYAAMIAHTYAAVAWVVQDAAGNAICFHFPKISYMPGDPNVGAKNADINLELPFTAIMDPTTGATMIVTEIGN